MKTIKSQLIANLAKIGAEHVADTTCWNYHNNNLGANSNLARTIKELPSLESGWGYFVVVGAKGQSQHSETALHIFKAKLDIDFTHADVCYRNHWFA